MDTDDRLPALRAIEILPFQKDGEIYFGLRDPAQLAARPIAISAAGCFVLAHLDGLHTCADIRAAARQQTGMELPESEILNLVHVLEEGLFLQGERVTGALAERRAAYAAAPVRDNRDRYPAAGVLRSEIEQMIAGGAAVPVKDVRGLIAPHLDYGRGRPCYAYAYATLAQARLADRYVILGTNHFGDSTSVVATTKDFQTPLGVVTTDRAFIREIEARTGAPLCRAESDHLREHSIELQVHVLQTIADGTPFEIVPVLCPDVCGPTGTAPIDGDGPDLRAFAAALAELVAIPESRTVVVAGADLSHVGQRFNDPGPTTQAFLEAVARSDRNLLGLLAAREEERFLAELVATGNPTRICSAGCVYALLRSLPGAAVPDPQLSSGRRHASRDARNVRRRHRRVIMRDPGVTVPRETATSTSTVKLSSSALERKKRAPSKHGAHSRAHALGWAFEAFHPL